ncbi:unnamed protein product, partial [Ectocarpus fasciculatus]
VRGCSEPLVGAVYVEDSGWTGSICGLAGSPPPSNKIWTGSFFVQILAAHSGAEHLFEFSLNLAKIWWQYFAPKTYVHCNIYRKSIPPPVCPIGVVFSSLGNDVVKQA